MVRPLATMASAHKCYASLAFAHYEKAAQGHFVTPDARLAGYDGVCHVGSRSDASKCQKVQELEPVAYAASLKQE